MAETGQPVLTKVMATLYNDMTPAELLVFDREIAEYFRKELAKPQPRIIYLPTAQYGSEPFIGPLDNNQ